jgi:hypothetical protein
MLVFPAVWFVASCASLLKSGLMQMRLLELIGLVGMASQTGTDRIRLQKSRCFSGMGVVARDTLSLCPWMWNLGFIDLLDLIAVAGGAERSGVGIGKDNFAIFRGRVAHIASLVGEGRVSELLQQFRLCRLVRIMALRASGCGKRLPLVCLDETRIFDVMAIYAECRDSLRQVIIEFLFSLFADVMGGVASVTAHVESGVPAAFLRHIHTLVVAIETKVRAFVA